MNGIRRRGSDRSVVLAGSFGQTFSVAPGLIDDQAIAAYTGGQCHALALVLHEATGWQIWGSEDDEFSIGHVAVRSPDGQFLDITGLHDVEDYVELEHSSVFGSDEDFLTPLHPVEVGTFGSEDTWREPDLETARSFVEPLLRRHGLLDALLPEGQVPDAGPLPYDGAPIGSDRSALYM